MACTTKGKKDDHRVKPWCSTKVTEIGEHIEGEGNWGDCGQKCPFDDTASIAGQCKIMRDREKGFLQYNNKYQQKVGLANHATKPITLFTQLIV